MSDEAVEKQMLDNPSSVEQPSVEKKNSTDLTALTFIKGYVFFCIYEKSICSETTMFACLDGFS